MKKTTFLWAILLISAYSMAQSSSPNALARALKQSVKEKMKFTEAQTDTVMSSEVAFLRKWRATRTDDALSDKEKKAHLKEYKQERTERIQSSLHLSSGQLKKLQGLLPDQLIK